MVSRVEIRERNRARLVDAARAEFGERGYRDSKIDAIAARAGLTRGAVYSNFPSKRALFFAVLAEDAAVDDGVRGSSASPSAALGALARAWVARLPLSTEPVHPSAELLAEIAADEATRRPYAQLVALAAAQIGHALGALDDGRPRVRQAQAALTVLEGARQLASAAPGLVEPFHIVRLCESLPEMDVGVDPALPPPLQSVGARWAPPAAVDLGTGEPADLDADGIVAVLGVNRLSGITRALGRGPVALVVVATDPAEVFGLVRLSVAETHAALRCAFPPSAWPRLRIVLDDTGAVAAAAGLAGVGDSTEVALYAEGGRVLVRAEGLAACAAVAAFDRTRR